MGFFPRKTPADQSVEEPAPIAPAADPEKTAQAHDRSLEKDNINDLITKDAQAGIQKVEAVTAVWSKTHLILAYTL